MKICLRIVAVVIALAVGLTVLMIVQFAVMGSLTTVARSGALGVFTVVGWLAILTSGPVAAVQLWRLRRFGLSFAAVLSALALTYSVIGLFIFRTPDAPLRPILETIFVNGALLGLLVSPAARRVCVE